FLLIITSKKFKVWDCVLGLGSNIILRRISLAVEPSLALSKLQTTGKGYDNNTRVEWNKDKSNELKFRGINIFSLNVSF
ncbi:MAG TPA: hypothetical protein DD396_00755, partial [Bacteroidetes bacterium]|nr:hypothetical protein [Bacteroidota bacterium]